MSCDVAEQYLSRTFVKAANPERGDQYAKSVAMGNGFFVVGSEWEDGGGRGVNPRGTPNNSVSNSGAAYVYARVAGRTTLLAYVKGDTEAGGYFGASVAASDDLIAIGAPGEDAGGVGGAGDPLGPGALRLRQRARALLQPLPRLEPRVPLEDDRQRHGQRDDPEAAEAGLDPASDAPLRHGDHASPGGDRYG